MPPRFFISLVKSKLSNHASICAIHKPQQLSVMKEIYSISVHYIVAFNYWCLCMYVLAGSNWLGVLNLFSVLDPSHEASIPHLKIDL